MKTLKFKTNINSGSSVASVKPTLDSWKEIDSWKVDITNPEKVLTIETNEIEEKAVIERLSSVGYKAEAV